MSKPSPKPTKEHWSGISYHWIVVPTQERGAFTLEALRRSCGHVRESPFVLCCHAPCQVVEVLGASFRAKAAVTTVLHAHLCLLVVGVHAAVFRDVVPVGITTHDARGFTGCPAEVDGIRLGEMSFVNGPSFMAIVFGNLAAVFFCVGDGDNRRKSCKFQEHVCYGIFGEIKSIGRSDYV